jgi:hypothetical protein
MFRYTWVSLKCRFLSHNYVYFGPPLIDPRSGQDANEPSYRICFRCSEAGQALIYSNGSVGWVKVDQAIQSSREWVKSRGPEWKKEAWSPPDRRAG